MAKAWTGGLDLVGRDDERNEVLAALDREPGNVLLHGPAGIGKTHLASAVADAVDEHGCSVARVVGTRTAAQIPLGAFASLLPPVPAGLADRAGGADDLRLLRHALDAVPALADDDRSLLLVVDDAHNLDPTSALLVQQLGVSRAVKLLLTVRSTDPVPEPVAALWTSGDAIRVDLEQLDDEGVALVLAELLGAPAEGATAHRFSRLSEGNPLFLLELAAAAVRDGWLKPIEGVWRVRDGWQPHIGDGRLADLLNARVDALDTAARDGLEIVALAEILTFDDADALMEAETLDRLEEADLVVVTGRDDDRRVQARHPLVGELIRSAIPTNRRRRLYGTLAAVVKELDGGDEATMRRALWLLESGEENPELYAWAARYARFAQDFETGMRFARAVTTGPERLEAAVLAGEMAYQIGDYEQSDEWLTAAAQTAITDEELALVVINHLSTVYWGLGDWGACERLIRDFRERHPDSPWVADLEGLLASLAMFSGEPNAALERLAPLRRRDDLRARVEVAFVEAGALTMTGHTDRAVEVAGEGFQHHVALGEQIGLGSSGGHMLTSLAALSSGGLLDQAEAMGDTLYRALLEAPNPFGTVLVTFNNGRTALAQGRPATAERWFREGAAVARDHLDGDQLRWCLGGLALALAMQSRREEANAVVDEARSIPGLARLHDIDRELADAWLDAARGELTAALDALAATADRWAGRGFATNEVRALQLMLSFGAAASVVERLPALAAEMDSPLVALAARQAVAVVAGDVDELEAVAAGYLELGARLAAAEVMAQAARIAGTSSVRRATRLVRRARDLLDECEGTVNPVLVDLDAVVPLTNREREVALLAARGLRSRDIAEQLHLSVRTVDNHLHRVYTKLGVDDRAELGEALGRD